MKTVAIIQARMGSTRLPGKVLADICGKPMLYYVVERTRQCSLLQDIVVATSRRSDDNPIFEFCKAEEVFCFRGDEDDVLKRFREAACASGADVIVRLTGDCPLIDPGIVGEIIRTFRGGQYDYASNVLQRSYPAGLDTEVLSRDMLDMLDRTLTDPADREHVTRYLRLHRSKFRTASVVYDRDLSGYRWTVDEQDDLRLIRGIYAHFGRHDFAWHDVLEAAEAHPEWKTMNQHVGHQQSYL